MGIFYPPNQRVRSECYLESNRRSLHHTAKGLMTLQALDRTISQIFGKGQCPLASDQYDARYEERVYRKPKFNISCFYNLLLLHRNVDLLMPLATHLPYQDSRREG